MKSKKVINNIITNKTTVIRNGKLVSSDDPYVAETMEKMQKKFGNIFNNGFFADEMENDENSSVESDMQEDMEDLIDMLPGIKISLNTSQLSANTITKVVQCKNCGANNTISSCNVVECEYCGSGLA